MRYKSNWELLKRLPVIAAVFGPNLEQAVKVQSKKMQKAVQKRMPEKTGKMMRNCKVYPQGKLNRLIANDINVTPYVIFQENKQFRHKAKAGGLVRDGKYRAKFYERVEKNHAPLIFSNKPGEHDNL